MFRVCTCLLLAAFDPIEHGACVVPIYAAKGGSAPVLL